MSGYRVGQGLTAAVASDLLTVQWDAERNEEIRLRFAVDGGVPTIRDLAVRVRGGQWATLGTNLTPEYHIVSGLRRISNQQLSPLRGLNVPLTDEIVNRYKWDAFWDAPLHMGAPAPAGGRGGAAPAGGRGGAAPAGGRGGSAPAPAAGGGDGPAPGAGRGGGGGNPPPAAGVASQPGTPRNPAEVRRASATFSATGCEVKTNGARTRSLVSGRRHRRAIPDRTLQYTAFKGSSLIRQEVLSSTNEPSLAYKYDTGLKGFDIGPESTVMWRDLSNSWQDYSFGGARNDQYVPLKTSNRIVAAQMRGGTVTAFPPPHSFFWAREIPINLGYS